MHACMQTTARPPLFQILFWSSIDRRLSALRTAAGLRKLAERGIVSHSQLAAFESCETSKAKALAREVEETRLDDSDGEVGGALDPVPPRLCHCSHRAPRSIPRTTATPGRDREPLRIHPSPSPNPHPNPNPNPHPHPHLSPLTLTLTLTLL